MMRQIELEMPTSSDADESHRTEQFVKLLARYERDIHTLILTLVPNRADADDVLQQTSVVLWRKFDQFKRDTDFGAWARQIARLEVHNFRRIKGRDRHRFDDGLVGQLADVRDSLSDDLTARRSSLEYCLKKLCDRDRLLVARCYGQEKKTAVEVARELERPLNTVYKALIRIRRVLFECIERTLTAEGHG